MIEIIKDNNKFFDCNVEAIVCTTNTVGVMGKGIALEFKKRFPDNFIAYKKWCNSGAKPGTVFMFERPSFPKIIFNFFTKDHWRYPSKIEWIASGLAELKKLIISTNVKSICIPALGCANGKLNFDDVKLLIISCLKDLDCHILLFEP